jgi:hypothetical protein
VGLRAALARRSKKWWDLQLIMISN